MGRPARVPPLVNGKLKAEISPEGLVSFSRFDGGAELLSEQKAHFWWPGPRLFLANGNGHYRLEQRFKAYEGEKLYGLGQHLHGQLRPKRPRYRPSPAERRGLGTLYGVEQRVRVPLELAGCRPCGAGRQRDALGCR